MLEKVKYINHLNESLEFGKNGLFVNENDLHDFAWEITSQNDKISGFKKGIVEKTIPVVLVSDSQEEAVVLKNKLFEIFEKDVLAVQPGKIIVGDYYLKCYAVESSKTDYLTEKRYLKVSLKISTDQPYWVKETSTKFDYESNLSDGDLDFNKDFPYDYTSNLMNEKLINSNFTATNFRLNIYGSCVNPKITIAGHNYEVDTSIESNEYLTIDSVNKTIILTHTDGAKENCFKNRNKDSYIFEKIPEGTLNVSINGNFNFEVTLLEERGEPKWT